LVALGLAAVVATLLTVAHPNHRSTLEGRAPLAHPTISAGMRGGLVPAVDLQTPDGQPQASQDLRPGVIALMPASCRCGDLVVSLADTTATATKGKLALFAIAPGVKNADGDALPGQLPAGSAVYDDPDSTLAAAIGGSGLTLVLVQPDGTIYQTLPDVTASSSDELTKQLVAMLLHPPAS
ncbi:MAG: hypothetical protein JO246_05520, partial [Frankiaceae bacterium]|nr:hypothetical protein [Frankiaceae bacterium]